MQRLIDWLAQHPLKIVVLTALLSVGALFLCFDETLTPRLSIDPSIEHLLPAGEGDRAILDQVRTTFGGGDAMLVAVRLGPIFTGQNLARIDALSKRLRSLPRVTGVFSLATAPNMRATGDELDISSFTEQARKDPDLIAKFPGELAENPIYKGSLVSSDGTVTAFAVSMQEMTETEFHELGYVPQIRKMVEDIAPGAEVWVTGTLLVRAVTSHALISTLKFTIPTVFVVILLLLLLAFRSVRAMIVAAVTVATALLWTMAIAVILQIPMNLVTAIVPPLVITLGLSYTIYLLSAHFMAMDEVGREPAAVRRKWVIERAGIGLVLSAATTMAGFMALLLNVLPAIREFAVLASIGSVLGVTLALSFMPAALSLIGTSRLKPTRLTAWMILSARRLARFDLKWRNVIIAIAIILVPLDLIFARRIEAGSEYIRSFDESSVVRRDFESINAAFNGANFISVLIDTHLNDALTDPELIRQIDSLETWLRSRPEVGGVLSYVDHLKLINRGMNDNDPAYYAVPGTPSVVKQLLVFGGNDELKRVIDQRFRIGLVSIRINVDDSIAISRLVHAIEDRVRALPPPMDAHVTGSPVLATRTVNEIASGQFESIAIATFIIWILLSLMFTSMRAGLIALLPTVVPVAIYFGTLGLFDITLSPTTSLIACIVIGIAVDDTIQFLARFNADARATGSETRAAKSALLAIIRPVTLSTVALCLGFLVFTGSELKSQVQFGTLSAFTLAMAWLMNVTLTPALGSRLRIVTLWDLLRLDLGQSPQHTIPLFSGLTLRQARIFALMSKLESYRGGARVITQGDLARDMFVVVDGTLEAFLEGGDERKTLATMGRGAVMGEAGYFGQRRTAHVDAITPVRVLRFDSQDLERMRVRYPRIAATVYRNLNRIQAERLARATAMLRE
jgi:predicted RND superfamily exporter protein